MLNKQSIMAKNMFVDIYYNAFLAQKIIENQF